MKSALAGVRILVTAGRTLEDLDGVRYLANHAHPADEGEVAATWLASQGAFVTLVTPKLIHPLPNGVRCFTKQANGASIQSGAQLVQAVDEVLALDRFDGVLHLASICQMRPASVSAHKIKAKAQGAESLRLSVVPNINALVHWHGLGVRAAGYDTHQNLALEGINPDWEKPEWRDVTERARVLAAKRSANPVGSDLQGIRVIITSGPTNESLSSCGDVLTNFSSGRQGNAVAEAFADRGAQVVLITGPASQLPPLHPSIEVHQVITARDMLETALGCLDADVYIGVAAVADFRSVEPLATDVFQGIQAKTFLLEQTQDVLRYMGLHPGRRPHVVVGFAAETRELLKYAKRKLTSKGCDAIYANEVGPARKSQDSTLNHVIEVTREGIRDCKELTKYQVGSVIADFVSLRLDQILHTS